METGTMRALVSVVLVLAGSGCGRSCGDADGSGQPAGAEPTGAEPTGAGITSAEPAGAEPSTPQGPSSSQAAVLDKLLGAPSPAGWRLRLAYDLDPVLLATFDQPGESTAVTVFAARPEGVDFDNAGLRAAFRDKTEGSEHPLEALGYDLVQPESHRSVAIGGRELPELSFAWLRVDPDTLEREHGKGTVLWMHCGSGLDDADRIRGRTVLLGVERDRAEAPDTDALHGFASALSLCP